MSFRDDGRGAALQVGAVLLLGFLVVFLSVYQVTVVPAQNERVEFSHSQTVQGDVLDLRNALLRAGTTTGVQPVTIDMGTRYASRVLFVNPPAPGGLLETGPERTVTLANVSARSAETRDFLNGSRNYTTRSLSYGPSYNVYGAAPTTTVRTGVVVNEFEDGASTARSEQTLVRGNEIYLVAVSGNLSRAQVGSLAVDPRTLSAATRTTTVGNATAGPLTLTVPTTLSADRWRDLLAAERDPSGTFPGRYVRSVSPVAGADAVQLTLEADETYRLRTAAVGVGTGLSTPDPAYLTNVTDGEPTLRPGDEVVVEVRDRYNNPVDPTTVAGGLRANVTNGTGLVERANVTVDPDGRARFEYVGGDGTLTLSVVGRSGAEYDVSLAVTEASGATESVDGGITLGGTSTYADRTGERTFTLASANGRLENVTCTDDLLLDRAEPVYDTANQRDRLDLRLTFRNPADYDDRIAISVTTSGTDAVTVEIASPTVQASSTLDTGLAGQLLDGGQVNLLDPENYGGPGSSGLGTGIDEVERFDDDHAPVTMLVDDTAGRVDATLQCEPTGTGSVTVTGATTAVGSEIGPGNSERGTESVIEFDLTNDLGTGVTITGLRIESQSSNADRLTGEFLGRPEVEVTGVPDGGSGDPSGGVPVDGGSTPTEITLGDTATVADGDTATVRLNEFVENYDSGGPTRAADTTGETVTVTVVFQNRPDETFTLSL